MKTQKEVKHVPTPWYSTQVDNGHIIQSAKINEDNYVGKCDYPEDAQFIVKCVNSHYQLLEALREAIEMIESNITDKDNINYLKKVIQQAEG